MIKTLRYNYRIYPTETQKVLLAQTFGCARYIYNYALDLIQSDYKAGIRTTTADVEALIPYMKLQDSTQWLRGVSSVTLQQSLRHLHKAYDNFFNPKLKSKMPVFKKKSGDQSVSLTKSGFRFKDGQLWLAKDDSPMKVIWSRPLPASPDSITITKNTSNQYFVSCVMELELQPLPALNSLEGACANEVDNTAVGIDLGIRDFATLSDGTRIANPRYLEHELGKLGCMQRLFSRKYEYAKTHGKTESVTGKDGKVHEVVVQSQSMRRLQERIRKCHLRIKNMRKEFLMKLASKLVHKNQVIVIYPLHFVSLVASNFEDLHVKGMAKNSRLARRIGDVGWGMFRRFLQHQCNKTGRYLVVIDRWFPSSQLCHKCKYQFTGLKAQKYWTCPCCGTIHDRDYNASRNIKDEGLRRLTVSPLAYRYAAAGN